MRGRKPKGCGTNGGYQRHMRYGEEPCEPCKEARRVAQRAWAAANPDKVKANAKKDRERNREKQLARHRRWLADNPEYRKRRNLKTYGLTLEDRNEMLARQGGVCALCGRSDPGARDWATDHDHKRGSDAVRGIVCHRCNLVLGRLGDSLDGVRRWSTQAIAYLIDYELRGL